MQVLIFQDTGQGAWISMDKEKLQKILQEVKDGVIDITEAVEKLKILPFQDIGYAKIDLHREIRKGFPEVIFCEGKTPDQVKGIVEKLLKHHKTVMATRVNKKIIEILNELNEKSTYFEKANIILFGEKNEITSSGKIAVITAGTADIPVAEEAAVTSEIMGNEVTRIYDIGVAGLHRVISSLDKIQKANIIIVVAGMDGVLPSIMGGLVDKPIIAVPTSIGYGANFNGLSALLTMLNSCAPGVSVVNIDNGFGAGYFAGIVNRGFKR